MIVKDARAHDPAGTDAEMIERAHQVFELAVNGANTSQIAKHFGISRGLVRSDIRAVTEELNADANTRSRELREEVTARERLIVLSLMPRVRVGDVKAATVVNRCDTLIAMMWGLRSIRDDIPAMRERDSDLTAALEGYLAGLIQR